MLDASTAYLILAMASFVFIAVVIVHHHNCSDAIRKRRNEVMSFTNKVEQKIEAIEQINVDLETQIEELDEQIDTLSA